MPDPTPTDPPKPGYKTTEFWLSLAAKLLGAAFAAGLIGDGTPLARIAGLAAVVLTSLGYTVNRAMVKAAAALLLLGLFAGPQLACATTASTVKAEVKTLEGCTSADASAIITATSRIVDDFKLPDRTAAAVDAIGQLAVIHAAWAHCKGAAMPTMPPAPPSAS